MDPLVSIIIPVYGVEKYISQCIESVVEQTYRNLEILIIDDESLDESGMIADKYAKTDTRIRVFHIQNRGAAGARNVGLENCSGDYIMFVDSDDWLEPNAVETMLNKIMLSECDIVQCQFYKEYLNKTILDSFITEEAVISDTECAQQMMAAWEYMLLWNKIIKKNVIEGMFMEEGHCIDDEFFTYKLIINSSRIVLIKESLYHYRMRKTSATGNADKEQQILNDQIDYALQRTEDLIKHYPGLKSIFLENKASILFQTVQKGVCYPDIFDRAKCALKDCFWQIVTNNRIDKNIKKSMIMYMIRSKSFFEKRYINNIPDTEELYA